MKAWACAWLGAAALTAHAGGDPVAGRKLFSSCANCHAVGPAARHGFGPHLNALVGRPAGSLPGYAYSAGMKASGLKWDEATLTAFLRAPSDLVPGTKMRYWGVGVNEQKVRDLLAYLAQQDAAPAPR
ncbi:c-type cytochrome [Roseateles sp. BYS87W]|uniref:C-type cytochrome n=1 Tax=Pelomonas baiyunensis TaxID=3299026 RepID=A0ABW7GZL9_9BURK